MMKPKKILDMFTNKISFSATDRAVKFIVDNVCKGIYNEMVYGCNIHEMLHVYSRYVLPKIFKNAPDTEKINDHTYKTEYITVCNDWTDFTIYKGVPIVAVYTYSDNTNNVYIKKRSHVGADCMLYTINTKKCVDVLNDFVEKMDRYCASRYINDPINNRILIGAGRYGEPNYVTRINKSFKNVFIPTEQRNELINTIHAFINKRDWYTEHNISYHMGILLHGDPGTGKTSLVQALANEFNMQLAIISGVHSISNAIIDATDQVNRTEEWILHGHRLQIVLIEDIDCSSINVTRDNKYGVDMECLDSGDNDGHRRKSGFNMRSSMSEFLNLLDGINSPQDVIFILTSNHIDHIDPAIIRPGRIDICMEIKKPNYDTVNQFFISFYDKSLPPDIKVRDDLEFAKLQVEVLKGTTYDEMLDIVSK